MNDEQSRNMVTVRMALIDNYTQLANLEKMISEVRKRADIENITDVYIKCEASRGYYDDIDVEVFIEGRRKETDEEHKLSIFIMRLADEARQREQRVDYERLKKKFEGG